MKSGIMIKKISILIIVVLTFLSVGDCKENIDLSMYVSQNRKNIYKGESENYSVTVHSEERENPYVSDSFVGVLNNIVTIKIEGKNSKIDGEKVKFFIDKKEYNSSFNYNPINGKYTSEIIVDKLPNTASLNLTIYKDNSSEENIEVLSKLKGDTLSSEKILQAVSNYDNQTISQLFRTERVVCEIHIRLLNDDDKNYFYVGFIEEGGKTTAYLVDGQTGKVLATKKV